jgi:hypothetical protein
MELELESEPELKDCQRAEKVNYLLSLLVIFNFFDLISTMTMYQQRLITEANPLMDYFLSVAPFLFCILKILIVYFGVGILSYYRYRPFSLYASYSLVILYFAILIKHAHIIFTLF